MKCTRWLQVCKKITKVCNFNCNDGYIINQIIFARWLLFLLHSLVLRWRRWWRRRWWWRRFLFRFYDNPWTRRNVCKRYRSLGEP